ncbi:MAG: metallophosphoesterase, partial [Candidatus Hermodarchaeota archaeon]
MDKINILHLSDLHFGINARQKIDKEAINNREATLNPLLIKLKNLNKNWKPNIVVISGDIGYKGIKNEYDEAIKWLEDLLKVLNLKPDRLIICAGNHDRYRIEKDASELPINIQEADDRLKDIYFEENSIPFSNFIKFQKRFKIPPLKYKKKSNYLIGTREILGLNFLVLNSAWFAWGGERDIQKMIIGKPQLTEMKYNSQIISRIEKIPDQITIAVLHHPFEELDPREIETYEDREPPYYLLAISSDLILCGHKHGEELFAPDKKNGISWLFKAGATYEGPKYKNNCEILQIDPKSLTAKRLKIYYIPDKNKWREEIDDRGLYLFYTSLSRLRLHTHLILNKNRDKIGLNCKVKRKDYLKKIEQELQDNDFIFIIGNPMVGKSVLMKDLGYKLNEKNEVIAFNIDYFNHNNLSDYLKEYNITDNLEDILNSIKNMNFFVFIDQGERILEDVDKKLNVFKDLVTKLQDINLENKELKIIIACRIDNFENVYTEFIQSYNFEEKRISVVKIDNFSNKELSQVFTQFPNLNFLYNQSHLTDLLKNPKFLDILMIKDFKLFPKTEESDFSNINLTETYFMDQFWKQIVRNNEISKYEKVYPESRAQLLHKISLFNFKNAKSYKILADIDFEVLKSLTSDKILNKYKDQIYFSHDVYEEWSLLDFIKNKSSIKDDFLIPYNIFKRNNRAFQLFSRYLLEVDNDYETWKSLFIKLECDNEINPNWIQELILGILKSKILFNLLKNLKVFLFEKDGNRLYHLLKILQLKCITYERKYEFSREFSISSSRPVYHIWSIVINFILMNFQELNNENLYECSEIIRKWFSSLNPYIFENLDLILIIYEEIANKAILNDKIQYDLKFEKEKQLKMNIIYSLIKIKTLKQENNLEIIEKLRISNKSKWLFKDVLFEMFGWIPLYFTFPDYTINLLKDFFTRNKESLKIIPTPFDIHEFHSSFFNHPRFSKECFKILLEEKEKYGLKFIHLIINDATDLWRKIVGPVVYGPDFRIISYERTPIPQIITVGNKEIEVWGDDIVYKWPIHLGPESIKFALQALEEWLIQQILQNNRDPIDLISKILSNTNSFAVVSVCSHAILHILFSESLNDPKNFEILLKSLLPIIEKPIFWILQSIISSEEYVYYRKKSTRFENIIEILLFFYTNLDISKKVLSTIESFRNNIPFMFEEEKLDKKIILDRQKSINLILASIKIENYKPFRDKNFISMKLNPPEDVIDIEEMRYGDEFLRIISFKGTIFNALDNNGSINNYTIEELLKHLNNYIKLYDFFSDVKRANNYFQKLIKFLKSNSIELKDVNINDLPEDMQKNYENLKYLDQSEEILELITGFFTLLVLFKWDFVKLNNLEEKSKEVILKTLEFKSKKDAYSAYMRNTMGIHQSAAKAIPRLCEIYPNNKVLKRALNKISTSPNHQVRDIFFMNLRTLWNTHPNLTWKLIAKIEKESRKRAIIMNPEFLVINKYRDPRIKRSQYIDITKVFIKKLYLKRALKLIKNKFRKQ